MVNKDKGKGGAEKVPSFPYPEEKVENQRMDEKNHKRKRWIFLFPVLGMTAGIILLLYPYAMDRYNEHRNEQAISSMASVYDRYEDHKEELERQLDNARHYNEKLAGSLSEEVLEYDEQLSFDGEGKMGYIEIPKIHVKMILYHGTGDETLAVGAGHLEGSSLPVGGTSTHTVITAHSGMKTMRAFDDLRELEPGDRIMVTTLGKKLTYQVESTETVLPYETESLAIIPGEDRVTLITCTPYGINDHRLLVHAVRTKDEEMTIPDGEKDERTGASAENTEQTTPADHSGTGIVFSFDRRTIPFLIASILCLGMMVYLFVQVAGKRKERRK